MNLESTLKDVVKRIRSGLLQNEAQVKQSVIVPILRGLGWDDANPAEFVPEFSIGSGRVDYALRGANDQPLVFVEAKGLGKADSKGEEQLFGYANNKGVPLLVLTDGDVWNFYLSMAVGEPAERRFYRMELRREEKISGYAKFLNDHLQKSTVISGEAKRRSEKMHDSERARKTARGAIAKVWQNLLNSGDEMLRDLLVDAVESDCGQRPELDDVEEFLNKQAISATGSREAPAHRPLASSDVGQSSHCSTSALYGKINGFVLDGESFPINAANKTLAEVLKEFQRRDSTFMARFAAQTMSRTRRLVAQNREDLYDKIHLAEFSMALEDGWWLGTNLSTQNVRTNIKIACEIAGVKFGSQLTLLDR